MPPIEVDGLVKDYPGVRAVDHATFTVDEGEIFGFFGPNGAGKTTTMRCLTGLTRPDAGSIRVAGVDVVQDPVDVRDRVAYLEEVPKPYRSMTGRRYLGFHAGMLGLDGDTLDDRVDELAGILELGPFLDKRIKEMSMGQRQRTELARLLLSDASVMFLDEPFNSVDTQTRRRLREHLQTLCDEGRTILYTSHDLLESEHFVDRYAFIVDGEIVAEGTARDLRRTHLVRRVEVVVDRPDEAVEVLRDADLADAAEVDEEEGIVVGTLTEDVEEADVVAALVQAGHRVQEVRQAGTIEDVFEVLAEEGSA